MICIDKGKREKLYMCLQYPIMQSLHDIARMQFRLHCIQKQSQT
jgi:hypothetical protein